MSKNNQTCRICLEVKPPNGMRSIFKKDMDNKSPAQIMKLISGIKTLEYTYLLPTKICQECWCNIYIAKKVREQCINSDDYFKNALLGRKHTKPSEIIVNEEVYCEEEYEEEISEQEIKQEVVNLLENEDSNQMGEIEVLDEIEDPAIVETSEDPQEYYEEEPENVEEFTIGEIISEELQTNPSPPPEELDISIKIEPICEVVNLQDAKKYYYVVHQCSYCGKTCKSASALTAHHKIHLGKANNKKFTCDLCGDSFAVKAYIYRHMNYIHINSKKHECKICGKRYTRTDNLKNHMYSHMENKPYPCNTCQKSFVTKQLLTAHTRSHTGERPFKCEFCPKTYAHYTDKKRHEMTHTGERPYSCLTCGKGFIKRSSLQVHEKVHMKRNYV